MTDLTALTAPTWIDSIRSWFAPRTTETAPADIDRDHAKAALIVAVQNGYIVEDTGERATIPAFVRTQLVTAIRDGDA